MYLLQVGLGGIEASWAGGELGREVKLKVLYHALTLPPQLDTFID